MIEQRKYERRPLYHAAWLTGANLRQAPCKIRDYCPGGIFLACAGPGGDGDRLPLVDGDSVRIGFKVRLRGQGEKTLELAATVVRVFPHGLGLSFDQPDPAVLGVLEKLAEHTARRLDREAEGAADDAPAVMSGVDAGALLTRLRGFAIPYLRRLFEAFYKQVDECLFQQAAQATSNLQQTALFADIKLFQDSREQLLQAGLEAIDAGLAGRPGETADGDAAPASRAEQLAIVGKEEFETFLSISGLVSKMEPRHEAVLFEVEKRLQALLGRELDAASNPLGIAAILNAIAQSLDRVDISNDSKRALYALLEEVVAPDFGDFYQGLNTLLKDAGLLPELDYEEHLRQQRRRVSKAATDGPARESTDSPARDATAGAAAAPPSGPVPPSPGPELSPEGETLVEQTRQLGQVLRSLQHFLEQAPAQSQQEPGSSPAPSLDAVTAAPDPAGTYTPEEIAQALNLLHKEGQSAWSGELDVDDSKTRLLSVLQGKAGQPQARRLGETEENALTVVSDIYAGFEEDPLVPRNTLKPIASLLPVMQKMAVLDRDFLTDKSHPARRLLNHMAQLETGEGEAADEQELQRQALVEEVGRRVVSEYDNNPRILAEALADIDAAIDAQHASYRHNIDRLVAEQEQQQAYLLQKRAEGGLPPRPAAHKMPMELEVWLERARQLRIGDMLAFKRADKGQQRQALAWVGEDYNPFVFVDTRGKKAASMTLQELALQLRRGTAVVVPAEELPAVERALQESLYRVQKRIERQALYDSRTGLANRRKLAMELHRVLARVQARGTEAVLALADFNCIHVVDRQWGRDAGDALLTKMKELLAVHFPDGAGLFCLGGDRFALLLEDASLMDARDAANGLIEAVGDFRFKWRHQKFSLRVHLGMAPIDAGDGNDETVLAAAEQACAEARQDGGRRVGISEPHAGDPRADASSLDWRAWLSSSLDNEQVALFAEPVRAQTGDEPLERHIELLLPGMAVDDGVRLLPAGFHGDAAQAAEMLKIDRLILRGALDWLARQVSLDQAPETVFIRLSGHSMAAPEMIEYVMEVLTETRVPPSLICFQVTEQAAVEALEDVGIFMRTLREFGCRFCLCEFGRGESAQVTLKELPLDTIAIDGLFIRGVARNPGDFAMVKSLREIAALMGLNTLAEAVDSEEVMEKLREIGLDYIQGEVIAEPRPLAEHGVD